MIEATSSTARDRHWRAQDEAGGFLRCPVTRAKRSRWRGPIVTGGERDLAEEIPVAFTYNGSTHAVMMASPCNFEDFAIGFSLNHGIVRTGADCERLEG